MSTRYSALLKF